MDRVVTALGRVQRVKAAIRGPTVELPCINCRYYKFACTHPAVAEVTTNPETGAVKSKAADPKVARSEGGACGPEGALFDSRTVPGLALAYLFSSKWRIWAAIWVVIIALDVLWPYAHHY